MSLLVSKSTDGIVNPAACSATSASIRYEEGRGQTRTLRECAVGPAWALRDTWGAMLKYGTLGAKLLTVGSCLDREKNGESQVKVGLAARQTAKFVVRTWVRGTPHRPPPFTKRSSLRGRSKTAEVGTSSALWAEQICL